MERNRRSEPTGASRRLAIAKSVKHAPSRKTTRTPHACTGVRTDYTYFVIFYMYERESTAGHSPKITIKMNLKIEKEKENPVPSDVYVSRLFRTLRAGQKENTD